MSNKMKKIIFLLLSITLFIFTSTLYAKHLEVDYSVEFGIVGEVARAHATLTSTRKTYTLDATVSVVGAIAKTVTDNLNERHISQGHIEKSLLVTDLYQMIKSYGVYTSTTIYRVNHKKKSVTRQYIKWKKKREIINEKVTLPYYSKDDMMTLFLNLSKLVKVKDKSKNYRFKAVGEDRRSGRVDISVPSDNALKEIKNLLGEREKGDWYSKVIMHRKLYNSQKGELDVLMGADGIVKKAILKDLIFFGDIRIIRQ